MGVEQSPDDVIEEEYLHCQLPKRKSGKPVTGPSVSALQELLWDKVGIMRESKGLNEAADTLLAWEQVLPLPVDRPSHELCNMILVGRLMAEAALIREESRGAHFRMDFPNPYPEWQKHIVFKR
jgi:L-aspartate oxidase